MFRVLLATLLLLFVFSPLLLIALCLETSPRETLIAPLSVDDIENVQRLLRAHDPRSLRHGEKRQVVLTQREINLLFRYALPEGAAASVSMMPELSAVSASVALPSILRGYYLNVESIFVQNGSSLEPLSIAVGRVRFPSWATAALFGLTEGALNVALPEFSVFLDSLETVRAEDQALAITFRWRADLIEKVKARGQQIVLPKEQRERVLTYYSTLAAVSRQLEPGASVAALLKPIFEQAVSRSVTSTDAARENRAALIALGLAMRNANPAHLQAPGALPLPRVRRIPFTLRGRRDLALHFVISAALTAGGGSKLADAIGVFKELSDSRGGSGFSFPDLLADRAGVVLAERATGRDAHRIQRALAEVADETLFMPEIDRLPERLQELEFRRRYRDLDTPAYAQAKSILESRIAALPLYQ